MTTPHDELARCPRFPLAYVTGSATHVALLYMKMVKVPVQEDELRAFTPLINKVKTRIRHLLQEAIKNGHVVVEGIGRFATFQITEPGIEMLYEMARVRAAAMTRAELDSLDD